MLEAAVLVLRMVVQVALAEAEQVVAQVLLGQLIEAVAVAVAIVETTTAATAALALS